MNTLKKVTLIAVAMAKQDENHQIRKCKPKFPEVHTAAGEYQASHYNRQTIQCTRRYCVYIMHNYVWLRVCVAL